MTAFELRTESDGSVRVTGLASRTGVGYRMRNAVSPFTETIQRGAFSQTLAQRDLDVVLTVEHDRRLALARTPATLSLRETDTGLEFDARLDPQDPEASRAISRVQRGVLRECSFAFAIPPGGDTWSSDMSQRTIKAVDLHRGDVALTVYGANPATGARVTPTTATLAERNALARAVSAAGWCGPGVVIKGDVRGWANQHGKSCETCDGSGDCPDCDGQGWTSPDDDGDADEQLAASGRQLARWEAELMQMRLAPPESRIYRPAASSAPDTTRATEALLRRWGAPQLTDWG